MAKYTIGEYTTVLDGQDGTVLVTRPSMISNKIHTVTFTGVSAARIATWLLERASGMKSALVQDAFPQFTDAEREFLMTGITEEEWGKHIADDEEASD
jgi:hypothetical protein